MRRFILPLLLSLTLAGACGDCGEEPQVHDNTNNFVNNEEPNNIANNGDTNNGDTNNGDTNNGDTNNGDTNNNNGVAGRTIEAHQLCAAAGVSSGNGYVATTCLSPLPVSGQESTGSGYVWKPSATRVITE